VTAASSFFTFFGIFLDLVTMLAQALVSFFKLAIAFFLLWLILDLFLLRPLALSESSGLLARRNLGSLGSKA
jgi:hypothetical protein